MWWKCPHCGRRGEPEDARTGSTRTTRKEPGYDFDACKRCCPSSDDDEHARYRHIDRLIDEMDEAVL